MMECRFAGADIHERDLGVGGCRQHVLLPQGQVIGEELTPKYVWHGQAAKEIDHVCLLPG